MRRILSPIVLTMVAVVGFVPPGMAGEGDRESRRKLVAEEHYGCGQHYPAKVFRRRKAAEKGEHPANQKLNDLLKDGNSDLVPGPRHGWIRVYRKDGEAEFVHEKKSGRAYYYIGLEKDGDRWEWAYSGDTCKPLAWAPKAEGGTIELREGHPPEPSDTRLRVLVHEWACHGYRVPDREDVRPKIIYGKDNVIVILRIEYPEGGASCPGTPPFRYTVRLSERLGNRALVDGGMYPPDLLKRAASS